LFHVLPGGAPRDRREAAEVGDDVLYGLPIARVTRHPLVEDGQEARGPFGPGRLARQRIEGSGQQLDHAQQRVGIVRALPSPASPLFVLLPGRGFALGLRMGAQAHDPTDQVGDDARIAADRIPLRGAGKGTVAEQLAPGQGREGQELHDRRTGEPAAAEEQ
jgi:hypothetical protein